VRAITFCCDLSHIALTVQPLHLALRLPSPALSWPLVRLRTSFGENDVLQSGLLDRVLREVEALAFRVHLLKQRLAKQIVSVRLDHHWELAHVRRSFAEILRVASRNLKKTAIRNATEIMSVLGPPGTSWCAPLMHFWLHLQ